MYSAVITCIDSKQLHICLIVGDDGDLDSSTTHTALWLSYPQPVSLRKYLGISFTTSDMPLEALGREAMVTYQMLAAKAWLPRLHRSPHTVAERLSATTHWSRFDHWVVAESHFY